MGNDLKLGQNLGLRQTTTLAMTQQMKQAIALLPLSTEELELEIQAQMLENPLLELADAAPEEEGAEGEQADEGAGDEPAGEDAEDADVSAEMAGEESVGRTESDESGASGAEVTREVSARDELPDIDWSKFAENSELLAQESAAIREVKSEEDMLSPLERCIRGESLTEHLMSQVRVMPLTEAERFIAELIVGNLDEDGYLTLTDGESWENSKAAAASAPDARSSEAGRSKKRGRKPLSLKAAEDVWADGALDGCQSDGAGESEAEGLLDSEADEADADGSGSERTRISAEEADSFWALGRLTPGEMRAAEDEKLSFAYAAFGESGAFPGEEPSLEGLSAQVKRGFWGDPLIHLVSEARWSFPNVTYGTALGVLQKVQRLDPVGVAARSRAECLLVQLSDILERAASERRRRALGIYLDEDGASSDALLRMAAAVDAPLVEELLRHHWREVAGKKVVQIARQLGTDRRSIEAALDWIGTSLQLNPGRQYSDEVTRYAEPDVEVTATAISDDDAAAIEDTEALIGGGFLFRVELCRLRRFGNRLRLTEFACRADKALRRHSAEAEGAEGTPASSGSGALSASQSAWLREAAEIRAFRGASSDGASTPASSSGDFARERSFLRDRLNHAAWFIKAVRQRESTIEKVAKSIVRHQMPFFLEGISRLRPLTLRDVAEDISMSESTVSRIVTSKFIQTPQGLFPMKYFFTAAITASVDGGATSNEAVRQKIRDLIAREDKSRPLSDQEIVGLLRTELIDLSRRTVAKYREQMGIPTSAQRRRHV